MDFWARVCQSFSGFAGGNWQIFAGERWGRETILGILSAAVRHADGTVLRCPQGQSGRLRAAFPILNRSTSVPGRASGADSKKGTAGVDMGPMALQLL